MLKRQIKRRGNYLLRAISESVLLPLIIINKLESLAEQDADDFEKVIISNLSIQSQNMWRTGIGTDIH